MKTFRRPCLVFSCAMLCSSLFLISGCGGSPDDKPETAEVSGTVKMDGEPLAGALVTFRPQDHETARNSTATTDKNGYYELKYSLRETGAMLGKHKVTISTAGMGEVEYSEDGATIGGGEKVPAKYNVNTTLVRTVKPGSQTIDFLDLKSEGEIIEVDDSEDPENSGSY